MRSKSAKSHLFSALGLVTALAVLMSYAQTAYARYLYVASKRNNEVSVVQTDTGTANRPRIAVGDVPSSLVVNPAGTRVYVANYGQAANPAADTVSVIDTASNKVVNTIGVGDKPVDLAVDPDGSKVYVVNAGTAGIGLSLSVINASDGLVTTLDLDQEGASSLGAVAIKPYGSRAYVTDPDGGKIWVVDTSAFTADVLSSIDLPPSDYGVAANPQDIVVSPDGEKLVVTDIGQRVGIPPDDEDDYKGSVWVIDTDNPADNRTSIETAQTGPLALSKAGITVDGSRAYVTGSLSGVNDDTISEVDISSARLLDTIIVDEPSFWSTSNPASLAMSPEGTRLWAGNDSSYGMTIFSVNTESGENHNELLAPISITGQTPSAVALVPNQSPVAALSVQPGPVGSLTRLDASASFDPDDHQIDHYEWVLGDGDTATSNSDRPWVDHKYDSVARFTASVTAVDRAGNKGKELVYTGKTAIQVPGNATASASFEVKAQPPAPAPVPAPSPEPAPAPATTSGSGSSQKGANEKPRLTVRNPKKNRRYRTRKLKAFNGTAKGGSKIKVTYSLARKAGRKCRLLTAKGKRNQRRLRSCNKRYFKPAKGSKKWRVKLKPPLKPGSYILKVKARNSEGETAAKLIKFKIR